jgi:hypothetical protein
LQLLHQRIQQRYDGDDPSHQEALKLLWGYAFPGEACTSLVAPRWVEMGWQQKDPSSDFRGAGLIALQNLIYLAQVNFYFEIAYRRISISGTKKSTDNLPA